MKLGASRAALRSYNSTKNADAFFSKRLSTNKIQKNFMRGNAALLRLVKLNEEMRLCAVRRWERTCVRDQAATSETHLSASFTSPRKAWGIRQASSPLLPVDFGGGVARGVKLGRLRWIAENYQRHRRYVFRHSEKPADSLHALLFGRNTAPARAKP